MRSENILSADILDLIFENRNKNYGAYMLRKHYNSHMVKALLYTFLMVAAGFSGTLFFKTEPPKEIIVTDPYVIKLLPEVIAEKPKAPTTMAQPKSAAK